MATTRSLPKTAGSVKVIYDESGEKVVIIEKEVDRLQQYIFGKDAPQAVELETAVLGALLIDKTAMTNLNGLLVAPDFYLEAHQQIFTACLDLSSQSTPIDILTVTEQLRRQKRLDKIGGAFYIVDLTNRTVSAANIEYHARIIKQKSLERQLIRIASQTIKDVYEGRGDIFDLYDQVHAQTRIFSPNAMFRRLDMTASVSTGALEPPRRMICGSLLRESDVAFLFGGEGTSKSVLAFQIGEAAASGQNLFQSELFRNECPPLKTLIFDFELDYSDLADRYGVRHGDTWEFKQFSPNLIRIDVNPEYLDLESANESMIDAIKAMIEKEACQLAIIDNISWIVSESHDPAIATKFCKRLLNLSRKADCTILVIGHTPKRDTTLPIESRHMAGAKAISNFVTSVIAIGESKQDKFRRYIKHLKRRKGEKIFTEDNVAECTVCKEGPDLRWEFTSLGYERQHLTMPDSTENDQIFIDFCLDCHAKGVSYRAIAEQLRVIGCYWSHMTVKRKIDARGTADAGR
jgi:hypothetical protein